VLSAAGTFLLFLSYLVISFSVNFYCLFMSHIIHYMMHLFLKHFEVVNDMLNRGSNVSK
jgi:hypothetical protein